MACAVDPAGARVLLLMPARTYREVERALHAASSRLRVVIQ